MVDLFVFVALLIDHNSGEVAALSRPVPEFAHCEALTEALIAKLPLGGSIELRTDCVPASRMEVAK